MKSERNFYSPNDKLNNQLREALKNGDLRVENRQKEIETDSIVLSTANGNPFLLSEIPNDTRLLLDCVATLWKEDKRVIAINEIWRLYAGKNDQQYPTIKDRDNLKRKLLSLSGVNVTIKIENKKGNKVTYIAPLLGAAFLTLQDGAMITRDEMEIGQCPPLLAYANYRKRVLSFPAYLLGGGSYATEDLQSLKLFLLREIGIIKNQKNYRNNVIMIDRLYRDLSIKSRVKKARTIDTIKNILDYFADEKYIGGYVLRQKNEKLEAIEINN